MDRQARVRQLYEDGTALVLCTESCAMECNQCGGCRRETEGLVARNPEGALPGELVLVRPRRRQLLMAWLMLFALPIVGFFTGYWIGRIIWNAGRFTGCIALALGIGAALIYDRRIASKPGSGYTVVRYPQIINKGDNGFD